MVPTANNHTPTPEPTGDLEQLFRQKLGEAEVAPRMNLWEQIDHELLVQQNETFRRRLVWHRWVAAACILLFLGAGSWLTMRQSDRATLAGAVASAPAASAKQHAANTAADAPAGTANPTSDLYLGEAAAASLAAMIAGPTEADMASGGSLQTLQPGATATAAPTARGADRSANVLRGSGAVSGAYGSASSLSYDGVATTTAGSFYDRIVAAARPVGAGGATWLTALNSQKVALAGLTGNSRPDTLKPALPSAPTMMAAQLPAALQEETKPEAAARPKRWRLMGGYAASAYNPNMSFAATPAAVTYANSVNGSVAAARTASTYEQAAHEYRQYLRPGFAQRVALTASYAASKHLTVSAGLAVAEQRATSQTSYYFLDGKMPVVEARAASRPSTNDFLTPPQPVKVRTAQYRYRTAGIPVSVRYGSAKPGWSLYAKVGAAVNVLFNTRSELEGVPEATTSYTLKSVNSPYRKVQGSVNTGGGVRYQPGAASWSVAVGPTAEAGLSTLNTDAVRSNYQARPYAVGLEASVEFGSKAAVVVR
ncbi:hypothetical protein [Hymenobacter cellulosivorans]|uniref:PorT family protein n=1 Tax=Hymenobacter cellulosivorans TaxID=2932249 RepID=A0ABY4FA58_9BACT|nr:hypothetical protein [Hymenobacter cellulosivorans]UOQ53415.1 hypothetical protein MUN80_01340 [Hymenobacter cellulosivorans]